MEKPQQRPTLITMAELAERWSVSISVIYSMVGSGELPTVRLGRLVKIPLAAVALKEQGSATPARS